MVNRAKAKGTAAESAVVAYLQSRGWPFVERRTLSGANDKGDIAGIASVCIEVKSVEKLNFSGWLKELAAEKRNSKARVGAVWAKRRGTTDPGQWYVVLTGEQFVDLLIDAGFQ